jgi:hypothetical protein
VVLLQWHAGWRDNIQNCATKAEPNIESVFVCDKFADDTRYCQERGTASGVWTLQLAPTSQNEQARTNLNFCFTFRLYTSSAGLCRSEHCPLQHEPFLLHHQVWTSALPSDSIQAALGCADLNTVLSNMNRSYCNIRYWLVQQQEQKNNWTTASVKHRVSPLRRACTEEYVKWDSNRGVRGNLMRSFTLYNFIHFSPKTVNPLEPSGYYMYHQP